MGNGKLDKPRGRFDLILSVRYNATSTELTAWEAAFEQASRLLFDATDGQHQFGTIYVYNNDEVMGLAGNNADAHLFDDPSPEEEASSGGYAALGSDVHIELYDEDKFRPFVIVHELGHYIYGLYDEYILGGPTDPFGINHNAHCFGERGPDEILLATACIMEAGWRDGDRIGNNGDGVGSPVDGQASEFCVVANHTTDNLQHDEKGQSCWDTMVLASPTNPDPGDPDPTFGLILPTTPTEELPEEATDRSEAAPINWIVLGQAQRFVLTVDRSGSMTGDKLDKTKEGANFWVDSATDGDRIGVVSYSDTVTELPSPSAMYVITDGMDLTPIYTAIGGILPGGLTAIGDGLRAGLSQIQGDTSIGPVKGQDVIALVTDGHHNTGEHPNTVLDDLINYGVQVYTIGIGSYINENLLRDIAHRTGGKFYRISSSDPLSPEYQIENKLIEIEGIAHGGDLVDDVPGSTNPGVSEKDTYIERGSKMATFTLSWDNPRDMFSLELVSPNGDTITQDSYPANVRLVYSRRSYMGFQVNNPAEGTWKLVVIPPERVDGVAHFHLFAFSQNPHIQGGIISPSRLCRPGINIPVQFQCYFDHPLTGLTVSGTVLLPDGESIPLEFSDDGNKELGDVLPGDGLYSTIFRETAKPGAYTIKVLVESDGESVSYARIGQPTDEDDERPRIPPFRRQFTRTVGVGEVPFKDVKTEPNSGNPGERLRVTLKGQSTHFKRGDTSADFGEGIDAEEVEVLDKHTAQVLITIAKEAQLGLRDVTITTARYGEMIEVEGGFQVVRYRSKCSVTLARLRKLLRTIWQGLAFVDKIEPIEVNRGQNLRV